MKRVEIKITVKVPTHCSIDDEDICRELEKDLNYGFVDITGFEIYEIETELINN